MSQERYGRYRIVRPLGQGGMASVHLAEDPVLRRLVAVKVLRGELGTQPDWVRRFRDEATAIARLGNPHVVAVFDFGRECGEDYLVMEFVEGIALSELLSRKAGRLDPVGAAAVACQVADGLRAAHGAGIIHRDIKPDNILIRKDGQAKIADFGISRILEEVSRTMTGSVFGSPLFMAPEQVEGRNPSGAIDVFALGGVLFRILSGRHPFEAEHAHAVMWRIVQEDAPRVSSVLPDVPPELDDLVASMHRRDPSARPRASEVGRLLKQFLATRGFGDPVDATLCALPDSVVHADPVLVAKPPENESAPLSEPSRTGFLRRHPRFVPLAVSGTALILAAFLVGKAWDRLHRESIPDASVVRDPVAAQAPRGDVPIPSPQARTIARPDLSTPRRAEPASPDAAIQVLVRDEAPDERNALKLRIALLNRSGSRIHWVRLVWPLEFPAGGDPVVDAYYAPRCAAHLDGSGSDGRLVVECSDLSLAPGQSWPGPDGMAIAVHLPDWATWKGKAGVGLESGMAARSDIRIETR